MSAGMKSRQAVELLAVRDVDAARFYLIHTLVAAAARRPRLLSVHRLLSAVAVAARVVVKGTDSQRRFNAEFAQFCRTALLGLADLEDAVFEARNPGRRAADAADDEVEGIREVDLIKEVAAFVASQTQALTAQYLEHIATSAVSKALKERERAGPTRRGETAPGRSRKRGRPTGAPTGEPAGGATGGAASGAGGVTDSATGAIAQDLVLIDERELLERAAQRDRGADSTATAPAPAAAPALPDGVYVAADGRTFDLRRDTQRLTNIEELSLRLEPWKIPRTYSAVEMERATVEKERRGTPAPGPGGEGDGSGSGGPAAAAAALAPCAPLLEVCLSSTPAELLRAWERREAVVSAYQAAVAAASPGPQGRRSRRRGESPPSDMRIRTPRPAGGQSPPLKHSSHGQQGGGEGEEAEEGQAEFFPSLALRANMSVPMSVISDLVHNGAVSIDFLY